jgi:Asp-tRNA(Asn)/Glu-tRNA(Gln) amidotransferase A subunit family amidase
MRSTEDVVPIRTLGDVPAELLSAFWDYDRALLGNDVAMMDGLFAPGPDTMRGDGRTLLVGHEAITAFRGTRAVIPTRRVTAVHVRMLSSDSAVAVAETRDPGGVKTGLQTQVWNFGGDKRWQVIAAHVSTPTASPAGTLQRIWRIVGQPLLSGAAEGPLQRVRVAVKDLYAVAGHRVGAGVPAFCAEQEPAADCAPVVQALLDAGAAVVGIAHTDEFAYSIAGVNFHYGPSPNPVAPHAASGGSTSGPASAVAHGQADVGLGTDTAGSIRIPASYLGLVGLRTTYGAIDRTDIHPLADDFDAVGWIARDIGTCRRILHTVLPDAQPISPVGTLTVLALTERLPEPVQQQYRAVMQRLADTSVIRDECEVEISPERLESWFIAFRTWQAWQAWQNNGAWIASHPGALGPDVRARFDAAAAITDTEADSAWGVVQQARAELCQLLDGAVLLLPTAAGASPPLSATPEQLDRVRADTLRLTFLAPLAGAPALSIPVLSVAEAWTSARSALGLSLVGAPGTDAALLDLAEPITAAATA